MVHASGRWLHCSGTVQKVSKAQLVGQPCAAHSEQQGVEARLTVLMAKLEGDITNVEFVNCSQRRDALRTVTKSVAAKGMDVKAWQQTRSYGVLAVRKELVELFDESTRAESCSVATLAQEWQGRKNEQTERQHFPTPRQGPT